MIEAFAYSRDDGSGRLIRAIQGRGAFRRFRDTVERLGLLNEWYEFRDNCYRERAVSWCHGHNISFVDDEDGGNEHLNHINRDDSSKKRGDHCSNRNGKMWKSLKLQEGRQGRQGV